MKANITQQDHHQCESLNIEHMEPASFVLYNENRITNRKLSPLQHQLLESIFFIV